MKMDWTLNNLQWLICHKTKPNQTKLIQRVCTELYGFKYSYQIPIITKKLNLFNNSHLFAHIYMQ